MRTSIAVTQQLSERFWSKVSKSDGCWIWTGGRSDKGYGLFYPGDHVHMYAHRMAFLLAGGVLRDGDVVCHRCDVPLCVKPEHLFAGSQRDNLLDMTAKGRRRNQNSGKTVCKHGHPLVGRNVIRAHDGRRSCRECARIGWAAYYQRKQRRRVSGTATSNSRDTCPAGHPRTAENTYTSPSGKTNCRACNTIATVRYKQRRRALQEA